MNEGDRNSPPPRDIFEDIGQWNPPMGNPVGVFQNIGQWDDAGRVSVEGFWEHTTPPEEDSDDDPESLRNLLSTLETEKPIHKFKRLGDFETVADAEKYYEEAQQKWIHSKEFAASDQHRLSYKYYNETVRIRFPKFSRGHKPADFREFIWRYVGTDRVVALGMLPLPNEWQMTLKDDSDREKLLRQKKMKIGFRNVWITPISQHEVRGMVHWLPMSVSNASIAAVLGVDGIVLFVETLDPMEKVELKHHSKGVRYFSMYLHRDKTPEDIPRVITVDGCKAFIGMAGRPPTCFHCRKEGHRKKECPIFNMMKEVHERLPRPTKPRARPEPVAVDARVSSDPYYGRLGATGQSDTGTTGQDYTSTIYRYETAIAGRGDTGTGDQDDTKIMQEKGATAGRSDTGTTDQGDTGIEGQDDTKTMQKKGATAGRSDTGVSSVAGIPAQSETGTTDQGDTGTECQDDTKTIQKVEEGALEDDEEIVEDESVDDLIDSERLMNIVAELQKLENEIHHTLEDSLDGLKEKMDRASRIFSDLLALR